MLNTNLHVGRYTVASLNSNDVTSSIYTVPPPLTHFSFALRTSFALLLIFPLVPAFYPIQLTFPFLGIHFRH